MATWTATLLLAGVLAALLPNLAFADVLQLSFSPLQSVSPGSAGNSFDILLTNTSGPNVFIGAFTFEVEASSPDVTFIDATISTSAAPYIFGGNSTIGPDILGSTTGQDLTAFDLYSGAGNVTIASGATVSLGDVTFDVSYGAPTEMVPLTLVDAGTSLASADGTAVPIASFSDALLDISTVCVPEPRSSGLFAIASAFLIAMGCRLARKEASV